MKRALVAINRRIVLAGFFLAALSGAALAQPAADPLPSWNDTGPKKAITDFVKSRVFGIGPQIGYLFPAGDMQGYVNLKGYTEFRRREPAGRLEYVADLRLEPGGSWPDADAEHPQIKTSGAEVPERRED